MEEGDLGFGKEGGGLRRVWRLRRELVENGTEA